MIRTFREYKPTFPEALPLVLRLYERHLAGCCLHIVLDDGNAQDDSVEWCIAYADENGCHECAALARMLRSMSQTQRRKLYVAPKHDWFRERPS